VEPQHTPGRTVHPSNPPWFDQFSISNSGAAYCDFYVNEQGTFLHYDSQGQAPIWTRRGDYCIHPTPEATRPRTSAARRRLSSRAPTRPDGRPWFLYLAVHAPHATGEAQGTSTQKFIPEQSHAKRSAHGADPSPVFTRRTIQRQAALLEEQLLALSNPQIRMPIPAAPSPTIPIKPHSWSGAGTSSER